MTDYKEIYGKMERINTKSNDFMSFNNKVLLTAPNGLKPVFND